jgi:hypothetical protein
VKFRTDTPVPGAASGARGTGALGRRLGALRPGADAAVPGGGPVRAAAEAPDDPRLALAGAEDADHWRLVLRAAVAQLHLRRLAGKAGRDHRRLRRDERHPRRNRVDGDLFHGVDHPALVAAHHSHAVGAFRNHVAFVVAAVPGEAVLLIAREAAVTENLADLCPLGVDDH